MESQENYGRIVELEGKEKRRDESNSKYVGCFLGITLISTGIIISFTGIGALLGIPLILAGIISPFVTKKKDLTNYRVICPTCGFEVLTTKKPGITCKACKKRMVLKGDRYIKID